MERKQFVEFVNGHVVATKFKGKHCVFIDEIGGKWTHQVFSASRRESAEREAESLRKAIVDFAEAYKSKKATKK